jgi:hypothetical protein
VIALSDLLSVTVLVVGIFTLFLLWSLYKAYETRNKLYYVPSGFFCSVVVGFTLVGLGHIAGFIIIIVAGFIFMPFAPKLRKLAVMNVDDASGSLRVNDVFSWYFIPKLERLYGESKAQMIFMMTITCIGGAFSFLLALLEIITFLIAGLLTVAIFVFSIVLYHDIKDSKPHKF